AVAIIAELRAVLDKKSGGDIARKLDELYTYMLDQLTLANFQNDGQRINRVIELMGMLHVSWKTVAQQPAGAGQPGL
ncbi:MAG: flagellar protein FliS, partial [Nitrospirota bacterium]|nr:flagellar protein FliS [Nitrospirota bacterium]